MIRFGYEAGVIPAAKSEKAHLAWHKKPQTKKSPLRPRMGNLSGNLESGWKDSKKQESQSSASGEAKGSGDP